MRIFKRILISLISMLITVLLLEQFMRILDNPLLEAPGEFIKIEDKSMHVYIEGNGEKTIVLLSGFEAPSPYIQYLPLLKELAKDYKMVLIEYFGYGYSDETIRKRSNENIIEEVRICLKELNIEPPYVLMPHSMSAIYSKYYAAKYPGEVEAIVSLDGSSPSFMAEASMEEKIVKLKKKSNSKLVGLYRLDWYLNYKKSLRIYSDEEIKNLKYFVNHNLANKSIQSEAKMVNENAKEVKQMNYPKDLPILKIIVTGTVDEYKKEGYDWVDMQNEDIDGMNKAKVFIFDGKHNTIYRKNIDSIVELTREFLRN